MIELLAKSPSGEVYFTRDGYGIVRRHRPLGSHAPIEVSETTVDWTIADHGYDRCDQTFATYFEAEQFVEDAVPKTMVLAKDLPVNPLIARSAVRVMEGWLDSPTDVRLVVATVNRLLADEAVAADAELKRALLSLSTRAAEHLATGATIAPLLRRSVVASVGGSRLAITSAMFDLPAAA